MKDSGIEWIGLIPESWEINKLRNCASFIQDKYDNNMGNLSYIGLENIVSWNGKYIETESVYDKTQTLLFVKDDILWGKLRPYLAKVYHAKDVGCCSSEFCVIRRRPDLLDKRYFWNLLISSEFVSAVNRSTYGTKMPRANPDYIKNIMIPTPTIEEQQRIANFLDAECARIDSIIEQTRATVEEYKKLKQSIITQAVTKGICPNRPMKDSGIEWIGKIPEDWEVVKMKRLCKKITDGSHFSPESIEDGYPYITAKDIRGIGIDYGKANIISRDDFETLRSNGCQPHNGDVLIVKDGATTGRVGLMNDDTECVLLSSVAMLTPSENISSLYLMYLLQSYLIQNQIMISMAGSAMPRITLSKLVDFYGIRCPRSDQKEICEYLFKKTAILDGLISQKESIISCLESYKKSLVYEYVTGKKEVL